MASHRSNTQGGVIDYKLTKRGLLSPINDVPYELLAQELVKRDVQIASQITACD